MANNKLRRAIEVERQTTYGEPHEKIAAQARLLDRALDALGGPVVDARPQTVTTPSGSVDTPRSEIVSSPISESIWADLGRPRDEEPDTCDCGGCAN